MSKAAAFSQDTGYAVTSLCRWMRCTHSKACSTQQVIGGQQTWSCGTGSANTSLQCQLLSALRVGFESPLPSFCFSSSFPPPSGRTHKMSARSMQMGPDAGIFHILICQTYENYVLTCLNFQFLVFPSLSEHEYPNALTGGFSSIPSICST